MQGHNGQLKSFVERIERLNEEEATIKEDKREIFKEAKAAGFDPKVMRRVIAIRAGDAAEQEEFETQVDLYLAALGHGNAFARDARKKNAGQDAPTTARIDGVAGSNPEEADDAGGPASAPAHPAQSSEVGAAGGGEQAAVTAPVHQPDDDLEIPTFLDRRKPIGPQPGEPIT